MKSRIFLITSLTLMVVLGIASISLAQVTVATNVDANDPGSPGATGKVLTSFTATEGGTGPETLNTFVITNGGTGGDAGIAKLTLYTDVNGDGALDFNDEIVAGATTTTTTGLGAGGVTLTATTPVAIAIGGTVDFLVVADYATAQTDNVTFEAEATLTGSVTGGPVAATAGQTLRACAVTATHLQPVAASIKPLVASGATAVLGADGADFLLAVDDYGNLDVDITDTVQATLLTLDGNASSVAIVATTEDTSDLDGGQNAAMIGGKLIVGAGGGTSNEVNGFALTGAENTALVFTTATDALVGSIAVRVGTDTTLNNVLATRGIEFYDTDHNGKIDAVTIFTNARAKDTVGPDNIPDDGVTNASIAAFTVAGYTITAGSDPLLNVDNGGSGILNGGTYGITLMLDEGADYDTGATPEVTYNSGVSAITGVGGGTLVSIVTDGAVEVDKAKPILLSKMTKDSNKDGKVDGIELVLSETVTGATANTSTVASGADPGAFAFALRNTEAGGGAITVSLSGAVAGTDVITLTINETIPNTGILPVLVYDEGDNNAITDSATNAQGAPAKNTMQTVFTSYAASNYQDLSVTDDASPIVNDVKTGDANADGQVELVDVTFSEDMNTIDAYAFGGVTFVSGVSTFGASGIYTPSAGDVNPGAANQRLIRYTVGVSGTGVYDTEAKPTFVYDGASNLRDANGKELAEYTVDGAGGTYMVAASNLTDGAPPVFVAKETGDNVTYDAGSTDVTANNAADGRVDTIVLTISEAVTTDNYDVAATAALKATALDASLAQIAVVHPVGGVGMTVETSVTGVAYTKDIAPTLVNTGADDTTGTLTVLVESRTSAALVNNAPATNSGDTAAVPTVAYALGAEAIRLRDMNDVDMMAYAAAASTDKALPFVMMIDTGDLLGSVATEDVGSGDGYLDNFVFFMSEDTGIEIATDVSGFSIASQMAAGDKNTFTLLGFDSDADTDDFATAADINMSNAATPVVDVSDNAVTSMFSFSAAIGDGGAANSGRAVLFATSGEEGDYDTEDLPKISYDGTDNVKDAAGNALAAFADKVPADKAPPVIVQAVGRVSKSEVIVKFSEDINTATDVLANGVDDVFENITASTTFFKYDDRNNGVALLDVAGAVAAGTIGRAVAGDDTRIVVAVDANLTVDDVEKDFIWLSATGIQDAAGNLALIDLDGKRDAANDKSIMITINDVIKPYIIAAWTVDLNNNGWIDHIKLELAEQDMDVTAFAGWVDAENNGAAVVVAGADGFADAVFAADGWDIAGFTGEMWDFTRVNAAAFTQWNPATPEFIFLQVDEENGVTTNAFTLIGDTDQAPVIDSAVAVEPKDFKGNPYTADPEGDSVILAAPDTNVAAADDEVGPVVMKGAFVSESELHIWLSEKGAAWIPTTNIFANTFTFYVGSNASSTWQSNAKDISQEDDGYIKVVWTDDFTITQGNVATVVWNGAGALKDLVTSANSSIVSTLTVDVTAWSGVVVDPVDAPTGLVIADIPGDNGNWVLATFVPSVNAAVSSYQFYRQDAVTTNWIYNAVVPAGYVNVDGTFQCLVPTPVNGEMVWGVVASTGTLSDMGLAAKAADVPVAMLVEGAAKAAAAIQLSDMVTATGGAMDNLAPTMLDVYAAADAAGNDASIELTWTPQADHGIVGQIVFAGLGSMPIYGVNQYNVYRMGADDFELIGSAPAGSDSFIDDTVSIGVVTQYKIELVDGNPDHTMMTEIRSALSTSDITGDLNGASGVDASDFAIFAANYGKSMAADAISFITAADFNSDGVVDASDFAIFATNYGTPAKVAAKMIAELPMSDIGFSINTEMDASTSMMYVSVSADDVQNLKGFALDLTYDTGALEFVENSVNGTVGLLITRNVVENDLIHIADMFVDEQFGGSVTFGFKVKGSYDALSFEIPNGSVFTGANYEEMGINSVESTFKVAPAIYALSKNYPNPFNPTTTIDYSIPQAGNVELVIYNTAGQKVRSLVNRTQDASYYKVVWDGRDESGQSVASGIYFYRLVSGSFSKIEKMTLIK
jgi:hypothetical protein